MFIKIIFIFPQTKKKINTPKSAKSSKTNSPASDGSPSTRGPVVRKAVMPVRDKKVTPVGKIVLVNN